MINVNITDSGRRDGRQPEHGPWGHKDEDLLSNKEAAAVFPPTMPIKAVPKQNTEE